MKYNILKILKILRNVEHVEIIVKNVHLIMQTVHNAMIYILSNQEINKIVSIVIQIV